MNAPRRTETLLPPASDAPVLRCGSAAASRDVFAAWIEATARWLIDQGIRRGDRVAFLAPAGVPQIVSLLACMRAGAIACPLNPRQPASVNADCVRRAGCKAEIAWPEGDGEPFAGLRPLTFPWTRQDLLDLGVWTTDPHGPTDASAFSVDADAPAVVVFTSGSTGRPRAAVLSAGNLFANARASRRNIPLAPGDAWLLSLPLYHVSGLGVVFRCIESGAAVAVPEPDEPLVNAIPRLRATSLSLVPTQLHRLLADPEGMHALGPVKSVLLGGSAIPEELLREVGRRRLPVATTYGLTETASQVATTALDAHHDGPRRAAPLLIPGTVRLSDDGEALVSGPCLFLGYLQPDGSLERPFRPGGWFATGDLGKWEADGALRILGRRDFRFVCGGENIQPEEVEAALLALPEVEQAIVVPTPDPEWGERPVAFVKPVSGCTAPTAAALREFLRDRLSGIKIPQNVLPWPEDLDAGGIKPRRGDFAERARRLLG